MSPAELFGICVATLGMYVVLAGKPDEKSLSIGAISVPFTQLAGVMTLTAGLTVLVAVFSRPVDWWPRLLLTGSVKVTVYWISVITLLPAAAVVVLARSRQAVTIGVTALAFSAGVLAAIAEEWASALTAFGLGICAAVRLQQELQSNRESGDSVETAQASVATEPFLLALSVVVLIWSICRPIHLAATTEAGPAQRRESVGPAFPRAVPLESVEQ